MDNIFIFVAEKVAPENDTLPHQEVYQIRMDLVPPYLSTERTWVSVIFEGAVFLR